jgi:two-component system chemotaxis sensor kinase CheA
MKSSAKRFPMSMLLTTEQVCQLEETVNRLATESILVQAGRDDGLVPCYSLLGDLRDGCVREPALLVPISSVHALLDKLLDNATPFDEETIAALRSLVEWLPLAIDSLRQGRPLPAFGAGSAISAPPVESRAAAVHEEKSAAEVMLELHLEDNQELLGEFHAEVLDHLTHIETALLVLDRQPDDPEALNSIFRSFHTIKGNAGFLGFVPMQALAHEVESLLDLARNHKLPLTPVIITEILRSRDALAALTQQVGRALEQGVLPDKIIAIGHVITALKKLAVPDGTVAAAPDGPAPVAAPAASVCFAPTDQSVAMVSVAAGPAEGRENSKASEGSAPGISGVGNQTVRVSTEKLDALMDVVGELVIVQSQLIETSRLNGGVGTGLQRNVAQLSRITKELQSTAMALRMIPIKATFQKMERLVRDLSRDFGKKVSFVTSGEDTELDRTVVEEMGDPLVHMVRNALDHGLESSAERVAKGKPETSSLHLRAYHQGGSIVIELQDDGKGIDADRIFRKAVEKGIIPAGTPLSRDEMLALIFAPGLSTAEKVTSVSGRGVGMDVVKRNIQNLRGKIEITSEWGRGSTFKIKLPLTMAIIDGLVVRVGEDRFILPTTSVQRVLRPARENVSTVHGLGEVLDLRGKFIPIHRVHQRFGIPGGVLNPWDGIVVIVENAGKVSALLVDEMISKQEVVIKNLGGFMQNLPGVAGASILGDGSIALIIDPSSLLNAA